MPCEECEQCGEKYYSDEVAKQVESLVDIAKRLIVPQSYYPSIDEWEPDFKTRKGR